MVITEPRILQSCGELCEKGQSIFYTVDPIILPFFAFDEGIFSIFHKYLDKNYFKKNGHIKWIDFLISYL